MNKTVVLVFLGLVIGGILFALRDVWPVSMLFDVGKLVLVKLQGLLDLILNNKIASTITGGLAAAGGAAGVKTLWTKAKGEGITETTAQANTVIGDLQSRLFSQTREIQSLQTTVTDLTNQKEALALANQQANELQTNIKTTVTSLQQQNEKLQIENNQLNQLLEKKYFPPEVQIIRE